jgi:serine/threonine-protein kinase
MGRVDVVLRRDGTFERLYAMKRLHPHLRADPDAEKMFVEEARLAGLLRHANVVSVIEVDADDEGSFLLMDYVEGVSLSELLRAHHAREVRPPISLCLDIGAQVARGLHAAHTLTTADGQFLGLVHRDVSPANILVGFDGLTRLTDFGIARAAGRSSHTGEGILKGRIRYMSPEQLRFERIDARADLFSLGVVLYELLTAERMFPDATPENVARSILHDPAPDVADVRGDVPSAIVELLFEMLAKEPHARPASAGEVADRIRVVFDEVVADEPPVDLGLYLEEWFGEGRARTRREIEERVRALHEEDPGEPIPVTGPARARRTTLRTAAITTLALLTGGALVTTIAKRDRSVSAVDTPVKAASDPSEGPSTSVATDPPSMFHATTPSTTFASAGGTVARPAARAPRSRSGPPPNTVAASTASSAQGTATTSTVPATNSAGMFRRWE